MDDKTGQSRDGTEDQRSQDEPLKVELRANGILDNQVEEQQAAFVAEVSEVRSLSGARLPRY